MTGHTPAAVCKLLDVSASTLRKYSLLFEKHGVVFKRNHNNSRIYTDTELVALQEVITLTKNGQKSLEDAVISAVGGLKGERIITQENGVTEAPSQRHDDDAAAVMLAEIRGLRQELKERDSLFVEALERMQQKIDRLEEQRTLPEPVQEETPQEELQPVKKKGFFARLFR